MLSLVIMDSPDYNLDQQSSFQEKFSAIQRFADASSQVLASYERAMEMLGDLQGRFEEKSVPRVANMYYRLKEDCIQEIAIRVYHKFSKLFAKDLSLSQI